MGKQRKWQNKMPNTTPREETASVGSRRANFSFGEACAFKRDPTKKAKGRDHFVHLLRRVHRTEGSDDGSAEDAPKFTGESASGIASRVLCTKLHEKKVM